MYAKITSALLTTDETLLTMSPSTAAHPSTPNRQSMHSLPSCPPAPKRPQSLSVSNDSMMIDFHLPAVPALNLQQLDFPNLTPIALKPRRSNKFPTNLRGRSPLKMPRTVKHSSRVGSPRLGSANLAQTFAHINMTQAFAESTLATTSNRTTSNASNGGTNNKRRMSKLSPQLSYPPLNRRHQQQGRHRSASFGSPAA